jgi:organic hydroperoxide reductase OsmC/OhrA
MAHVYGATVTWERGDQVYTDRKYSRAHVWGFDEGVKVPASSSPLVVKPPLARTDAVDPEEALVAATSSCHMLFFLDLASRQGFRVDRYIDQAQGTLDKRADGRTAMVGITLHPAITFSGEKRPTAADLDALHHRAHELCYIANSLNFEVHVEPPEPRFAQ